MTRVKIFLTALAGTILAFSLAQKNGVFHLIPPGVMSYLNDLGIAFGIFGASPLGRLIFKDAVSNDIVPPAARNAVIALFLLPMLALGSGCATTRPVVTTVTNALPMVTAYVQDAELVVTGLETFEKGYFVVKPNADVQKKIEIGIADARAALDAGLRICAGIIDLSQAQIGPAFADFQKVYLDVLALLGPLGARRVLNGASGARPHGGRFDAVPDGYVVRDPLLLAL